jgi:ankyrin repeat protein
LDHFHTTPQKNYFVTLTSYSSSHMALPSGRGQATQRVWSDTTLRPLTLLLSVPIEADDSDENSPFSILTKQEMARSPSPLHLAVLKDDLRAARLLLDCDVDPNVIDGIGQTPMAHVQSIEMLELLKARGGNTWSRDEWYYTPLHQAIYYDRIDLIKALLHTDRISDAGPDGGNLLSFAAHTGETSIIAALTMKGINPCFWDDRFGYEPMTPLLQVLRHGDGHADAFVFNAGFDILGNTAGATRSIISELLKDGSGMTLSASKAVRTLKRLLKRLRRGQVASLLHHLPERGPPAIVKAAGCMDASVLELLMDHGADIEMLSPTHGTAVMFACTLGRLDSVKLLVRQGANLNVRCEDGRRFSAIDRAVHHPRVVRWLLVERFTDQRCLDTASSDMDSEAQIKSWSGTRVAGFQLPGFLRMRFEEPLKDALKRLSHEKHALRGRVVNASAAPRIPELERLEGNSVLYDFGCVSKESL